MNDRDAKGRLLPGHSVIRLRHDHPKAVAKRKRERMTWHSERRGAHVPDGRHRRGSALGRTGTRTTRG